MARKRVNVQTTTLFWVCIAIMFVMESHHVCNGKSPDKAVTLLMAKKTTHTNKENNALLSDNFDVKFWTYGIVTHEASTPKCSWFLSHHSYSDFIY